MPSSLFHQRQKLSVSTHLATDNHVGSKNMVKVWASCFSDPEEEQKLHLTDCSTVEFAKKKHQAFPQSPHL